MYTSFHIPLDFSSIKQRNFFSSLFYFFRLLESLHGIFACFHTTPVSRQEEILTIYERKKLFVLFEQQYSYANFFAFLRTKIAYLFNIRIWDSESASDCLLVAERSAKNIKLFARAFKYVLETAMKSLKTKLQPLSKVKN